MAQRSLANINFVNVPIHFPNILGESANVQAPINIGSVLPKQLTIIP